MLNGMEKKCFKCGNTKSFSEFYKHKKMTDGRLGKCKECTKKDSTKNRGKNLERIREYDRKRGNRQTPEYQRECRKKNPGKYKAQSAVNNAVRDKRLFKKPCEVCGEEKVHGHHEDYSKPLEVIWLCPIHHKEIHI
tara:strand:- start:768 stop:1175 length:408 start_codon:yes stop_codon:yes gene_type:complete